MNSGGPRPHEHQDTVIAPARRDLFLRACRGEVTERVPVWFMRQAGRSLAEYRALREHYGILELCRTPELATEVTLQPVRRLGVDAAILFSDIVVPLEAMGVEVEIRPGVGPVIEKPIRTEADVDRIRPLEPESAGEHVLKAIALLKAELEVPLIGFAGAPFTLASYLIEGGPSKTFARTKALMYGAPEAWTKLMDRLAEAVLAYLKAQARAGADALQLFDSWAGALGPGDYGRYVLPWSRQILHGLENAGAPRIHFGVNTGELLGLMASAGADVLGVDWRVPLSQARSRVDPGTVLQGNLDPAVCLAPWPVIRQQALRVLQEGGGSAHVFNLGHGVLPSTDPDDLARLVDLVHEWSPADA